MEQNRLADTGNRPTHRAHLTREREFRAGIKIY
jgi:hypothetical protein